MRVFCGAAYAAFLVTSTLLVAEQPSAAVHVAKITQAQKPQLHVKSRRSRRHAGRSLYTSGQAPTNGVVIYNGNQRQTRLFDSSTSPTAPLRNLPPVVIGIATAGSKTKPVVVGISSSAALQGVTNSQPVVVNIASSGSSTQPVVLGVASTGFQTAGTVAPVAIGISPRPAKRPPYRPAALDRQ